MLRASPPDDGADADGRFDVDSVLVTEFLLSFVGTRAGRKLSSDIAARIQRAQRFQSFLGQGRFQRGYESVAAAAAARAGSASAAGLLQRVQESAASLIRAANRLDRL